MSLSSNESREFPYKPPQSESEYPQFFHSLIKTDFQDTDQETFRSYASILESAEERAARYICSQHQELQKFLHVCIVRAEFELQTLFEKYVIRDLRNFINLIPTFVWTMHSSISKRFTEPVLVQIYETLRFDYSSQISELPFCLELLEVTSKPATMPQKEMIFQFLWSLYFLHINETSALSKKTFFCLVREMTRGLKTPPLVVKEDSRLEEQVGIQSLLSPQVLKLILCCVVNIPNEFQVLKKEAIEHINFYATQELLADVLIVTNYLKENFNL